MEQVLFSNLKFFPLLIHYFIINHYFKLKPLLNLYSLNHYFYFLKCHYCFILFHFICFVNYFLFLIKKFCSKYHFNYHSTTKLELLISELSHFFLHLLIHEAIMNYIYHYLKIYWLHKALNFHHLHIKSKFFLLSIIHFPF